MLADPRITLPATAGHIVLIILIGAELAIPVIAERHGTTPWHPHHITERYGLFTLILLGESLLASANAIIEALHGDVRIGPFVLLAAVAMVVTAGLWWIYFWPPHHTAISTFGSSLRYGYVHYFAIRDNADRTVNIAVPAGAVLVLLRPLVPVAAAPGAAIIGLVVVLTVVVLVLHPPVVRRH